MTNSFLNRLWNLSPRTIVTAIARRVSGQSKPQWHTIQHGALKGVQLFLDPYVYDGWREMIEGKFDSFLYEALSEVGDLTGLTIWDIGAHFGYHSLAFSALVGEKGLVAAFEPNQYNISRFKKHMEKNSAIAKRILLVPCALSDEDGQSTFVISNDVDGSASSGSHISGALPPLEGGSYEAFQRQTVPTMKIDTLLETGRQKTPDVVKIDVEGAELLVLRGGARLFSQKKPFILMEVHNIVMMFYVQKTLTEFGYEMKILNEQESTLSRCFIFAKPLSAAF